MQQLWLVTVPNRKDSPESTLNSVQTHIGPGNLCTLHRVEIPALTVGTLDSLLALSDDLAKINSQVEVSCPLKFIFIRFTNN